MYSDILRRLWDAVRMKCPNKESTNSWSVLHENAPAHRPVLVKDLLSKCNVATLEHTPYFPDLAAVNFYLFRRMK